MKCEICNQNFENVNALIQHLRKHSTNYQDYLKQYIWKSVEYCGVSVEPGKCLNCGKPITLKMRKLQKFCCYECSVEFLNAHKPKSEIAEFSKSKPSAKSLNAETISKSKIAESQNAKLPCDLYKAKDFGTTAKNLIKTINLVRHESEPLDTESITEIIKSKYPSAIENYYDGFKTLITADLYIPEFDLYIVFGPADDDILEIAEFDSINLLELCESENIEFQLNRVINGLKITYSQKELDLEIKNAVKLPGDFNASPTQNRCVKHYQFNDFYKVELKLFKNPVIRRQLFDNRFYYTGIPEAYLTDAKILTGFKISAIHIGYSFFSPKWFKAFISKYKPEVVYDPFHGWGHRLLGTLGTQLKKYIGNDINTSVNANLKQLYTDFKKYFNTEIKLYNFDSLTFEPDCDFDCIFTCPPYDTLEVYDYKNPDFDALIKHICDLYLKKCKLMGIIIREDYYPIFEKYAGKANEKIAINKGANHFERAGNSKKHEFLYIWHR